MISEGLWLYSSGRSCCTSNYRICAGADIRAWALWNLLAEIARQESMNEAQAFIATVTILASWSVATTEIELLERRGLFHVANESRPSEKEIWREAGTNWCALSFRVQFFVCRYLVRRLLPLPRPSFSSGCDFKAAVINIWLYVLETRMQSLNWELMSTFLLNPYLSRNIWVTDFASSRYPSDF